ncbi:MAG: tripartite tricarboxylate transporter substrate binding protein [Burkholderiaceae bacterium]
MKSKCGLLLACLLGVLSTSCFAQNYPDKPIKLIIPYTPGGGTDTVGRMLAEKISTDLKWTILVDNKPGAGGNIGMDLVAKAKPDGYTLGMGQTSNLAINPALMSKMPFDAVNDLIPVAFVAEVPMVLVVTANSPWKTLGDLIKAAKAKPDFYKQATAGAGTVGHIGGEMLASKAGYTVSYIPYKGASPAITDLMGGQTDFMFATPQSVLGMIAGGKLRAIAVTSTNRIGVLSKVPTVSEEGYKGFEATDWKIVVAPAGTPPEAIKKINEAVQKSLKNPALISKLQDEASSPMYGDPATVLKYIRTEQREWDAAVKAAGIKLD